VSDRRSQLVLFDHSIVGQSATSLTIRKDRPLAACRLCGRIFQPWAFTHKTDLEYSIDMDMQQEGHALIRRWREMHNNRHSAHEHLALAESGLTLTPEAAQKLAPFGFVPVGDAEVPEIAQALREAPRAPEDDVEHEAQRRK